MQNRDVKKIYPISILRACLFIVEVLFFIGPPAAVIIICLVEKGHIFMLLLGVFLFVVFALELFWEMRKCIVFEESGIHVFSDKAIIFRKIQYEVKVSYEEISIIRLIATNKNSKGQPMVGCFLKMPYLLIECNNGKAEMINLYYYSKKQAAQIIDEIKRQAELRGNHLELPPGKDMISEFLRTHDKLSDVIGD